MAKQTSSNQICILLLLWIIPFCCCSSSSFVSAANGTLAGDQINGPSIGAFLRQHEHEEQQELADKWAQHNGDDDDVDTLKQRRRHNLTDAALNGGQKEGGEISVGKEKTEESRSRRRLFVAFVFGLSFRLPQESDFGTSKNWRPAGLSYDLSKLYAGMGEKYFADRDAVSFMAIFPNTNDTEQSRQCWTTNPYGTHLEKQLEKFYGTEEARQEADIGADAYEPERRLNSALMDRAEAIIASCSNASWAYPGETVKIVYITNFAEKSFAARNFSALESNGIVLPLILLAMNGATYNYHFYSIPAESYSEYRDWPVVVHLGIPKIDLIEYPEYLYLWADNFCRHVIYIVAMSDRLLDWRTDPVNQQFYAVNFAIKEPECANGKFCSSSSLVVPFRLFWHSQLH